MTNNTDSLYTPTITANGTLSHKTCSHDKTARERHNCRYESAKASFAESASQREAVLAMLLTPETTTFGNLN